MVPVWRMWPEPSVVSRVPLETFLEFSPLITLAGDPYPAPIPQCTELRAGCPLWLNLCLPDIQTCSRCAFLQSPAFSHHQCKP